MTSAAGGNGLWSRALPFALIGVGLLLWADFYVQVLGPALQAEHFPTSTYWVAPRLVLDGRADLLYDVEAFGDAAEELGAFRDRGFIPNAPTGVLPLLPFGMLPEAAAYTLWTLLGIAGVLLPWSCWCAPSSRRPSQLLGVVAVLPLFQPLRWNFVVGQEFAFVLLALVGAAVGRGARWRDSVAAGVGYGAVAILKLYYGLALLVPAVVQRRRRVVGVAAAVIVVAVVLSTLIVGIEGWRVWIETSLGWRSRPETTVTAYQTLNSLFGHLFRFEPGWNEGPVIDAPLLAEALWWLSVATLGIVSLVAVRRMPVESATRSGNGARSLLPVAIFVPVALVASPIAEDYHYVLALLPLIVGGALLVHARPSGRLPWLCFVGAVLLLAPPWPFNVQPIDGWWALLFYPRVYGGLLLWLALLALRGTRE